jgi:hypothetical protein
VIKITVKTLIFFFFFVMFVPGRVNCSHQMPFAVRVVWKELRDLSSFVTCIYKHNKDHLPTQTQ